MSLNDRKANELSDYLSVVRRRKWLITGMAVAVGASAMLLALLQTPVYRADARLLIGADASVLSQTPPVTDASFLTTQMQVIQSAPVQETVRKKFGTAPPVSVVIVGATSVVQISALNTDPAQAAAVANAYADAYLMFRRQQASDASASASATIQTKIDSLQKQIDDLGNQLASLPPCAPTSTSLACSQRGSTQQNRDALLSRQVPLKQQLDQLQIASSAGATSTQVVTRASFPTHPVSPVPLRNAVLGTGVGLLVGLVLAFVLEYFDDSIKDADDFERISGGLALLAMIPSVGHWKDRKKTEVVALSAPTSPAAESYRTLRTSIRFLHLDRPLRTIQITSASMGDGKTTTVANLGVVLARAGERVVLVSGDLRRPRLHEFFGLSNDIGFTSVLLGEVPVAAALQKVEGTENRLWLLASGPVPPNPSELLSSQRTSDVLLALLLHADVVLIDCPPILPVTDAAALSATTDGTLLVVSAGSSTRKEVSGAIAIFRQIGAPLLGAILNTASSESSYVYQYGYSSDGDPRGTSAAIPSRRVNGKNGFGTLRESSNLPLQGRRQ